MTTETLRIKVVGLRELNKVNTAVDKLDKKMRAINKSRVTGTTNALKVLRQELSLKNKILKADQQILRVRNKQITSNKKNVATQAGGTGGGSGGKSGGGGGVLSSALISGAFPLLFGQGLLGGAVGAIGGGVGAKFGGQMGGFAGGLAATAALTLIQNTLSSISELGQAMGAFTQDTQAMTKALGLQGSAQEAQIKRIEQTQGKTAAFNASMKMMENRIGESGVRKIKEFGETTRILGQQFSTALLRLQAFIGGMANFIAKLLSGSNKLKEAEIDQFVKDSAAAGNEQAQALLNREEEIGRTGFKTTQTSVRSTSKRTVALPGTQDKLDELKRDKEIFAVRNKISLANDEILSKSQSLIEDKRQEFDLNKRIKEEIAKGTNKELATSLAKVNQIFDAEEKVLTAKRDQAQLDFDKAKNAGVEGEELTKIQDILNAHTLELTEHNKLRKEAIKLTEDLHDQTDSVGKAFEKLSESINNDIKEGIKGLIKGTSTLGDMLNKIADRFLDVALNQALFGSILGSKGDKGGGILGAIGLFANGGRPPVGRPSIVGEKGPELFVPRSSGMIVPNNKLGGGGTNNVVVNVDATGSDVQGDDAGGQELGTLIAVAVQGEIVKQQRPGGLLNR